jgi:hypothetical protein
MKSKAQKTSKDKSDLRLPVLFVGHGSPLNAIKNNEFSRWPCRYDLYSLFYRP